MKRKPQTAIKKRTDTLSRIFIEAGIVVISVIAIFMILDELDVSIAPALAGLGIAGLAVGFGAQSLVKDLFNGLLILLENQYGVGDYIEIAGTSGVVQEVSLRRTVLRDLDGTVHSIPNGEITVASNFTKEWARVNMNISVGYGEDLSRVIEVINRVCKEVAADPDWAPTIIKTPEVLRVDALGDSGIDIRIVGETKPMQQWALMGQLRLRLKRVFDEEGIEIPWPHTKIYFGDIPATTGIKELFEQKTLTSPTNSQTTKRKRRKKLPEVPETDE
jgi:small conductance mechanosensitive channel